MANLIVESLYGKYGITQNKKKLNESRHADFDPNPPEGWKTFTNNAKNPDNRYNDYYMLQDMDTYGKYSKEADTYRQEKKDIVNQTKKKHAQKKNAKNESYRGRKSRRLFESNGSSLKDLVVDVVSLIEYEQDNGNSRPNMQVYIDQSGSWGDKDIEVGKKVINAVLNRVGSDVNLEVFYFADKIGREPDRNKLGSGGNAFNDILIKIGNDSPDIVIIMTDNDADYWSYDPYPRAKVDGAFLLFRGGRVSQQLVDALSGTVVENAYSF